MSRSPKKTKEEIEGKQSPVTSHLTIPQGGPCRLRD